MTKWYTIPVDVAKAFKGQRQRAGTRGIQFLFTREEWIRWWEVHLGPDWMQKRGCRKGQYVMARDGDEGPYASWNVRCITVEQNHKENKRLFGTKRPGKAPNGIEHWNSKLTESDVRQIFSAGGTYTSIAKSYNVSVQTISNIKHGRRWAHLYL